MGANAFYLSAGFGNLLEIGIVELLKGGVH